MVFVVLVLPCLLIITAQAKNNGVADYQKGMKIDQQDHTKALLWFQKSAQEGNNQAMFELGEMYENGFGGLTQDDAQALEWWKKAAALGNSYAMEKIGDFYKWGIIGYLNDGNGNTKAQDFQLAKQWYEQAGEHGDPDGF
ncbi:MAG: tetratricopeptide repeat protein, partial [Abditibacteriaceae bacterium]